MNTVYILGAGFSAHAGIPTMARFIDVAKDIAIQTGDPKLKTILDKIRDMSVIKNYCHSDLFNLEEVFSILEMEDWVGGGNNSNLMKHMITTVIHRNMPVMKKVEFGKIPGNYQDFMLGNERYNAYFHFLCNLFRLKFRNLDETNRSIQLEYDLSDQIKMQEHSNSIISLNYDDILERTLDQANSLLYNHSNAGPIGFGDDASQVGLYKLHGCIRKETIIPPTWAKSKHPEVETDWISAYQKLIKANRIVFIGYSLPKSDSYFKYFLKSAIQRSENLKEILVYCYDPSGKVIENYEEVFQYRDFRINTKLKFEEMTNRIRLENNNRWFSNFGKFIGALLGSPKALIRASINTKRLGIALTRSFQTCHNVFGGSE